MRFFLSTLLFPAGIEDIKAGKKFLACDPAAYNRMLGKLKTVAQLADDGGFEGLSFSEQHCNIEGAVECNTNPIMLDLFVAMQTKRIKVGQLGMVLSADHPWRIAEDLALLDQMTKGRTFCGFSRGNATRWVNMFAQHFGTEAAHSDKGEADEKNLRAIKEAWSIIKAAWTQNLVNIQGEFWQAPAPNTKWDFPISLAQEAGVTKGGDLFAIGAVPRPFQDPHPRIFAPLAFRMTTARFWVGEGGTAVCYTDRDEFLQIAHRVLTEDAQASSIPRRYPVLATGAALMIGKTKEKAERIKANAEWLFTNAYAVPPFSVPMGRLLLGTPDDVCRQIEALTKVIPFEDMFLRSEIGLHDEALTLESIEIFAEKIIPRFS